MLARLARVEARLDDEPWDWAVANAAAIDAHWARRLAERPAMFDGPVLLARDDFRVAGEVGRAAFFRARFRELLAFRDFGFPAEARALNAFAAAAARTRDGAFLLGVMAAHTANADQVYFPCGTPDPADLRADGAVDLAGSALRELAEETGLAPPSDGEAAWTVVRADGFLAFIRDVALDADAETVRARVRAHLAAETRPELQDVLLVSSLAELDGRDVPSYARAFLADAFGSP